MQKLVSPARIGTRWSLVGVAAIAISAASMTACNDSVWHTKHGLRYCTGTLEQCAAQAHGSAIQPGQKAVTLQARGSSWS